jgi:hypothetical protein
MGARAARFTVHEPVERREFDETLRRVATAQRYASDGPLYRTVDVSDIGCTYRMRS